MERIAWLDFAKGVAMISVVIGHSVQHVLGNHSFGNLIIIFEMPLFFLLSGILAHRTVNRSIWINLKYKFISLIVPFFVVGGAFAILSGKLTLFVFDMYHCGYWFLPSLFFCWIFFLTSKIIIDKLSIKKYTLFIEIVILSSPFICYKLLGTYIPEQIDNMLTLDFTFTYYRFFVIGYYMGRYTTFNLRQEAWSRISILSLSIYFFLFFFCGDVLQFIPMTLQQFILSAILVYAISVYSLSFPKFIHTLLSTIGRNTLTIYVFHYFILFRLSLHFLDYIKECRISHPIQNSP